MYNMLREETMYQVQHHLFDIAFLPYKFFARPPLPLRGKLTHGLLRITCRDGLPLKLTTGFLSRNVQVV
jgi:hypothetical protein